MTFDQIISGLQNKVYHPVYFLSGEEPYYIDLIADYIQDHVLNEMEKEFNLSVYYGRDTDINTLIGAAKRFPMMSNYQVVILREAQTMPNLVPGAKVDKDGPKKKEKNEKHPLEAYVENPLKSTILVICYKYKTIDKRKSFAKTIDKSGVLFESAKLYDDKIPAWITHHAKEKGLSINPKATMLLAESLGSDLCRIVNEMDKLTLNIPAGTEITPELVEMYIGISKDYNVFELQKAIGRKDISKSNQIMNHFASNPKENPLIMTISILFSFFSKLMLLHSSADKSRPALASLLSVNPFFLNDYLDAAKNFSSDRIHKIISLLREYDMKAKGVDNITTEESELMREMLWKIIH